MLRVEFGLFFFPLWFLLFGLHRRGGWFSVHVSSGDVPAHRLCRHRGHTNTLSEVFPSNRNRRAVVRSLPNRPGVVFIVPTFTHPSVCCCPTHLDAGFKAHTNNFSHLGAIQNPPSWFWTTWGEPKASLICWALCRMTSIELLQFNVTCKHHQNIMEMS